MRISDWSSDVCSSDLSDPGSRRTDDRMPMTADLCDSGTVSTPGSAARRTTVRSSASITSPGSIVRATTRTGWRSPMLLYTATAKRALTRTEERRGGKECVSKERTRWQEDNKKKKK